MNLENSCCQNGSKRWKPLICKTVFSFFCYISWTIQDINKCFI